MQGVFLPGMDSHQDEAFTEDDGMNFKCRFFEKSDQCEVSVKALHAVAAGQ